MYRWDMSRRVGSMTVLAFCERSRGFELLGQRCVALNKGCEVASP